MDIYMLDITYKNREYIGVFVLPFFKCRAK